MIYWELNYITLDIDYKYNSKKAKEKIKEILKVFDYNPNIKIFKRKSSSGNLHILIIMDNNTTLEEHFFIRLYLGDDIKRIENDIKRLKKGLPFNRLWDYKYNGDEYSKAGEWVRIK